MVWGSQKKAKTASREILDLERRVRGKSERDPAAWKTLAEAYAKSHDAAGAFHSFRKYADLLPEDAAAARECGIAARKAGALREAMDYFARSLALAENVASTHSQYAKVLDLGGMVDEALEAHQTAIDLDPNAAACRYHLGVTYARHGRHRDAIETYEEALRLDPSFARAHGNLGVLLDREGSFDRAIEALRRAITLEPRRAEWHSNLGALYGEHKMYEEAIEEFSIALRLDPKNAEARFNLGIAHLDCGQYDEAVEQLSAATSGRSHPRPVEEGPAAGPSSSAPATGSPGALAVGSVTRSRARSGPSGAAR
jgi:tetratricopeptide (TPR) repeat protein